MLRRTRVALFLEVLPALKLDAFLRPNFSRANQFCLGIKIEYPALSGAATPDAAASASAAAAGSSSSPPLRLRQLASISDRWRIGSLRSDLSAASSNAGVVLGCGETLTLYYDAEMVTADEESKDSAAKRVLCPNLVKAPPSTSAGSSVAAGSPELSLSMLLSSTTDISRLFCLGHLPAMGAAIARHKRDLKKLEQELLGKDAEDENRPASIEEVRKRNQKLAIARREAGLPETDAVDLESVPAPWTEDALSWGMGGGLHLAAMWEFVDPAAAAAAEEPGAAPADPQEEDTFGVDGDAHEDKPRNPEQNFGWILGVGSNREHCGGAGAVVGMATKLRVPVRPDKPNPSQPRRTCPLMLTCEYPERVTHAFSGAAPCCTVPVEVCVTNGAPAGAPRLPFVFDVIEPTPPSSGGGASSDQKNGGEGSATASPGFAWSGTTCVQVDSNGGLAPGESTRVRLQAHFFGPGSYNLNGFRFTIDCGPGGGRAADRTMATTTTTKKKRDLLGFVFPHNQYHIQVDTA